MLRKESQNLEIDNLDIDILKQLMHDATKPYTEIAKDLIVSGGTIVSSLMSGRVLGRFGQRQHWREAHVRPFEHRAPLLARA